VPGFKLGKKEIQWWVRRGVRIRVRVARGVRVRVARGVRVRVTPRV
jgi:hypothetical protein